MPKYRVAIIGSTGRGNYGHGLDTVWKEVPETEVVAVADDDDAGRANAAAITGAKAAFADYRKMLDEVKPQIVAVGPRWTDQHHAMVMACAERGMHVYMEKPFCRTLAEADDIIRACEATHTRVAIAHQTRYCPIIAVVKQLIADGKLGTILEIRARGKEDRRGGPEDLWVLGSHVLNLMTVFGGEPKSCFATLLQQGRPVVKSDVSPGAEGLGPLGGDSVAASYQLASGATGFFASRRNVGGKPWRFGIQIFGSKGVVEYLAGYLPDVYFLPDPAWSPGRTGAKWLKVSSQGVDQPETLPAGNPVGNIVAVRDLLSSIEQQRQPLCNMYEGRTTVEMILGAFESHRVQAPVTLPLKNRSQHPLTMLS